MDRSEAAGSSEDRATNEKIIRLPPPVAPAATPSEMSGISESGGNNAVASNDRRPPSVAPETGAAPIVRCMDASGSSVPAAEIGANDCADASLKALGD